MRSSVDLCSISDTPAMTQTQANVFDINVAPNTAQGNSDNLFSSNAENVCKYNVFFTWFTLSGQCSSQQVTHTHTHLTALFPGLPG